MDANIRYQVASDVNPRDGIGVEIYRDNRLVIEIFRDDAGKTKTVTLFERDIPLDLIEEAIRIFKKEIPQDFME